MIIVRFFPSFSHSFALILAHARPIFQNSSSRSRTATLAESRRRGRYAMSRRRRRRDVARARRLREQTTRRSPSCTTPRREMLERRFATSQTREYTRAAVPLRFARAKGAGECSRSGTLRTWNSRRRLRSIGQPDYPSAVPPLRSANDSRIKGKTHRALLR